jgi:hypothetical protein
MSSGHSFDIFVFFGKNNRAWVASAESVEAAHKRVQELCKHLPGKYLIKNSATGEEVALKAGL